MVLEPEGSILCPQDPISGVYRDVMNVTIHHFENCTFDIYFNLFERLYFVTSRKS